jgi:branched-chain amino acid transport system permease protein
MNQPVTPAPEAKRGLDITAMFQRIRPVHRWTIIIGLAFILAFTLSFGGRAGAGYFVEQFIIGLVLGSTYALIALGYTLVYGVIKLINFAHGDIYMLGAFFGYYSLRFTVRWLNFTMDVPLFICFLLSTLISLLLCAGVAVLMERLAYRPIRRSTRIAALITAVGVSFLLENLGIIVFGPNPKSYSPNTLEVYQVQIAADEAFTSPRTIEVRDRTQLKFRLDEVAPVKYARIRLVAKAGLSPFTPAIALDPQKKNALLELSQAELGRGVPPPQMLAVNSETVKRGSELLVLSWESGNPEFVRVPSMVEGKGGRPVYLTLPVKSSSGEDVQIPLFNLLIILTAVILLVLFNLLINCSSYGIAMRALSFDQDGARLMGVDVDKVIAMTFAIGAASAAVAGNMVGFYNQSIEPLMGILPGIKAFVAAVVGGIGSVPGAAVGGLIMGLSEGLVKGYVSPALSSLADAMAFAILIAVLLVKPSGIFGKGIREKV